MNQIKDLAKNHFINRSVEKLAQVSLTAILFHLGMLSIFIFSIGSEFFTDSITNNVLTVSLCLTLIIRYIFAQNFKGPIFKFKHAILLYSPLVLAALWSSIFFQSFIYIQKFSTSFQSMIFAKIITISSANIIGGSFLLSREKKI